MNSVVLASKRSLLLSALCAVSFACSSSPTATPTGSGGSAGAGTGGAASGTGGSGSGGATAGTGGGAGAAGSGGAGGGSGGVAGGSGGAAGGSGGVVSDGGPMDAPPAGDLAPPGLTGTQDNPGTDGDGSFNQPAPYAKPPETSSRAAGVPQGMVTPKALFASTGTYPDRKFKYSIYVPAQYQKGKRAALMVFTDARHYDETDAYKFNVAITFDNLIARGDIPVTIAVMIDPGTPSGDYISGGSDNPTYRSPQYDRSNGNYAKFLIDEFLTSVVLPNYDIVQDPDGWAIAGHSSGGSAAFAAAWNRTEKFHKVLTQNGSFNLIADAFPGQVNAMPAKPIRVYLNSGTGDMPGWMAANTGMANAFMAKGYHYRYMHGTGTHDPPNAGIADFPDSLKWLWKGYRLPWYR